uniref:Uncharacterized protein LOC104242170 n=1 Tax=Nicotiana sylvestris TaxID=4096 RepID=A0A1U7XX74_NICSY|nr:PREDICTED: uncharacterized protein LOC104242170 [Nicotiana sylvestris]
MSVREYSLLFNSLERYAPSIVAEISDRVHRFVVGLGPHLINECFTAALLDDRKRQQYENRDEGQHKKARSPRQPEDFLGDFMPPYPVDSVRQLQRLHYEGFVYSESSYISRISGFQNRRDSAQMRAAPPRCSQFGKAHSGQCRRGYNVCYTSRDPSHYMRDCRMKDRKGMAQPTRSITVSSSSARPLEQGPQASTVRGRGRGGTSSSGGSQNCMYAFAGHQDPEATPDEVSGTATMGNIRSY